MELAKRYHSFALSARRSAATSDVALGDKLIKIAERWEQLALEAENVADAVSR
jgi:hypothetical protein